jgi:hypothetical protein
MYTESSNEARVCDTDETTTVIVTATCKLFVLLFVLYTRHVKLRVPRGQHGSHLCCHECRTRQVIEVI